MGARRTARRVALALAAMLAACGGPEAPTGSVLALGAPVPAYGARSLEGDSLTLTAWRGEVVLLNVWATWCPPCRTEMPALQTLNEEMRDDGLRLVAVSIDRADRGREIERFGEEYGISFPLLHDPELRVTRAFQTRGVPETFLIGRDGRLLRRWIGRIDPAAASVRQAIQSALRG